MKKIVHVVGTGTIGEPLLGLFTDFRDKMGIDEVTFHKRTPLASDRAKLNHLIQRGAKLAVDEDVRSEFEKLGHEVSFESREALERATVVIDCTPGRQREQGEVLREPDRPQGLPRPGQRVRLRQALRPRHQRRGPGARRGPLPPDRLLQHPQHHDPDQDARPPRTAASTP